MRPALSPPSHHTHHQNKTNAPVPAALILLGHALRRHGSPFSSLVAWCVPVPFFPEGGHKVCVGSGVYVGLVRSKSSEADRDGDRWCCGRLLEQQQQQRTNCDRRNACVHADRLID